MKAVHHVTPFLLLITLFSNVLATPTDQFQYFGDRDDAVAYGRITRDLVKGGGGTKTGKYGQQQVNEGFLQYPVDDDDYQTEQEHVDENEDVVDGAGPVAQQTNYQQNQHTGNYGVKPVEPSHPQSPIEPEPEPEPEQETVQQEEEEDEECPDDLPTYRLLGKEKCGLLVDGELTEQVVNPEEHAEREETNPNQYPTQQQQLPDYLSQTQDGSYGFQGPHSNWGQIPRSDEKIEQETLDEDNDKYDKYEEPEPEPEQQHHVDEPEPDLEGYQQHINPNPATYRPGSSGSISGPHFGQHIVPSGPNYESPDETDDGSYSAGSESQWSQSQINTGMGSSGVNDRYPSGSIGHQGGSRPNQGGYRPIRYGSKSQDVDEGRSAGFEQGFNGVILNPNPHYSDGQAGGEFSCFQKATGYYVDYDSDCRKFYRCAYGHFQAYEFECGPGTKFNILNDQCEYAKDVYCHP